MSESNTRWLLPDGIDEANPQRAEAIESIRRHCLDRMRNYGYQLVIPPMVEFVDSLLTGVGRDLGLQTLKVTDQLSGRQLGIRADMTPQAARMDARSGSGANRLCYCGSTLKAKPAKLGDSRAPIQIGAELFGVEGTGADLEIIDLMQDQVSGLDLGHLTLDMGHVDLYRHLIAQVPPQFQTAVESALAAKDLTRLNDVELQSDLTRQLTALVTLQGDTECLGPLRDALPWAEAAIAHCMEVAEHIRTCWGDRVDLHFDFAEGRGSHYHTGLVFALYADHHATPIAQGGRYDAAGSDFGSTRAATGFSADLRTWQDLSTRASATSQPIGAPNLRDLDLYQAVAQLREQGEIVITEFETDLSNYTRRLVKVGDQWTIENAS